MREIGLLCDSRLESVSRRLPSHWQKIHFAIRCLRLHWRMCVLLHHRSEASSTALSQNISALLSLRRSCVRPILDCIRVRTSCCGCMRWLRQPAQQVALLRPVFRIHTDSSSELLYKSSSRKAVSSLPWNWRGPQHAARRFVAHDKKNSDRAVIHVIRPVKAPDCACARLQKRGIAPLPGTFGKWFGAKSKCVFVQCHPNLA